MRKEKKSFFRRLADALFEEEAAPADVPKPAARGPQEPAPDLQQQEFEQRLSRLVEQQGEAVVARLQFLDMDRLRAAVGDQWQEVARSARRVTEHVITQRLAPGDVFTPQGENGYLLLFSGLSPEESRLKSEAILHDVLQRLTGELGAGSQFWVAPLLTQMIRVTPDGNAAIPLPAALEGAREPPEERMVAGPRIQGSATAARAPAEVTPRAMTTAVAACPHGTVGRTQFINLEEIRRQFGERWEMVADKARRIALQVIQRRLSPADVFAPIDNDSYLVLFADLSLEQARLKVQAIARAIYDRLLGELDVSDRHRLRALTATVAELTPGLKAGGLNGLLQALDAAEDVGPPPRAAGYDADLQNRLGEVGATFVPAWTVRRRAVSLYYARALRLDGENRIFAGPAAYPRHDPAVGFEVDRCVLQRTVRGLRRLAESQGQVVAAAPLRLGSLMGLGGGMLSDLCRAAPPEVRKMLAIELVIPANLSALGRIGEAIKPLQPFCRGFTARVPAGFTAFEVLSRHKMISVTLDLEDQPAAAAPPTVASLAPLIRTAHEHRLPVALLGVSGSEAVRLGLESGFDLLSGSAIASETSVLSAAYAWEPAVAALSGG